MVVHSAEEGVIKTKEKLKNRLREKLSHVKAEQCTPVNATHKPLMFRGGWVTRGEGSQWASSPVHSMFCDVKASTPPAQGLLGLPLHHQYLVVSLPNL